MAIVAPRDIVHYCSIGMARVYSRGGCLDRPPEGREPQAMVQMVMPTMQIHHHMV